MEAHVDVLGNTHVAVYESNVLSQGEAAHYTNIMEGELIHATSKCSLNVEQAFIAEDADPKVYTWHLNSSAEEAHYAGDKHAAHTN